MTPSEEKDVREACGQVAAFVQHVEDRGSGSLIFHTGMTLRPATLRTLLAALQSAEQERDKLKDRVLELWTERNQILRDAGSDEIGLIARAEAAESKLASLERRSGPTDRTRAEDDAVLYGTGYLMNGKHVPYPEVVIIRRSDVDGF